METVFGVTTIPSIVIICYCIAQAIKSTPLKNKYIPIICGALGGGLGVAAMYIVPDFPAHDILTALAIGIVSGLSATGIHQIYKQLSDKEK